jgi:hypothetical protein
MPVLAQTKPRLEAAPNTQWQAVTPVIGLSQQAAEVVHRLRELAQLPAGWDGQGGPGLRASAVMVAIGLVNDGRFCDLPVPHMGPVVGGGLQFEWQVGPRSLEIEILPEGSIEYLAAVDEDESQGEVRSDSMLDVLFSWLMQC